MTQRQKTKPRTAPGKDELSAIYAWLVSRKTSAQEEMDMSAAGTLKLARNLGAREVCEDLLDFMDGGLRVNR